MSEPTIKYEWLKNTKDNLPVIQSPHWPQMPFQGDCSPRCHSGFQAASVDLVTGWHNGRIKQSFIQWLSLKVTCVTSPYSPLHRSGGLSSHSCKGRWEIGPFFAHKGREAILLNISNVYSHACKHGIICSSFCSRLNRNIPLILIYSFLQNLHCVCHQMPLVQKLDNVFLLN